MDEEIEAVRTKPVDRGHAYLVDQLDGAAIMATAAARALIEELSNPRLFQAHAPTCPGDAKDGIADGQECSSSFVRAVLAAGQRLDRHGVHRTVQGSNRAQM
jgi:hypothetical protein